MFDLFFLVKISQVSDFLCDLITSVLLEFFAGQGSQFSSDYVVFRSIVTGNTNILKLPADLR